MRCCRAIVAALFLAFIPVGILAAPAGLAWDLVMRVAPNAGESSPQPGSFDDDFTAAASVAPLLPPGAPSGGGAGDQAAQTMAIGQSMGRMAQMMQSGVAMRQYVAGSKIRTDMLAMQTAMIFDCSARTLTFLDLNHKTYRVTSLNHSSGSSQRGALSTPNPSEGSSRVAMTIDNVSLGQRQVSGLPSDGFRSTMTMTSTGSSGQSRTQNMTMTGYYSNYPDPSGTCAGDATARTPGRGGADMMSGYAQLMRVLASASTDPRYSLKQSGPPLPLGKLALYEAITYAGAPTFLIERGHVRPVDASDPVFSVPPGFTLQQ